MAFTRLLIDLLLSSSIIVLLAFRLTGLSLHEWLGLFSLLVLISHLFTNWRWLATTTRKLTGPLPWKTRLNYLLTITLLVAVFGAIVSGIVISRIALPQLGAEVPMPDSAYGGPRSGRFWSEVHVSCTNLVLLLLGLHLGLNWAWVAATINARIVRPLRRRERPGAAT